MLTIARRCIPFTPFEGALSSAVVAIVSATGVHLADQEPFSIEDPGDASYRVIPTHAEPADLRISHHHYDHTDADEDPNIVFPLASLHELADEGFITAAHDVHFSYGFTTRLRELYETTFVDIADQLERSRCSLVIMTAGCPETCHRSIGMLAREIEARGVPTLVLSAHAEATESVRPPRIMTWDGIEVGRIAGRAREREWHRRVIRTALSLFLRDTPPGRTVRPALD